MTISPEAEADELFKQKGCRFLKYQQWPARSLASVAWFRPRGLILRSGEGGIAIVSLCREEPNVRP